MRLFVCPLREIAHIHEICITMMKVTQQTRDVEPMILKYWAGVVVDAGPTLKQHWLNVSYLPCDISSNFSTISHTIYPY